MFTGLIEEIGTVQNCSLAGQFGSIEIAARTVLSGTQKGDSIAVNGACLTVIGLTARSFVAEVMAETLRRTNLGALRPGSRVNLERALAADGRFGGHIVSGHIDGTGKIEKTEREGNAVVITVGAPEHICTAIVEKGSAALDGISLTVVSVSERAFSVAVIPHTGRETTLLEKHPGDTINIENDIIGKYIRTFMRAPQNTAPEQGQDNRGQPENGRRLMDWLGGSL